MRMQRHFIIFRRTQGHCANWLVRAASLREALTRYALEEFATVGENGTLVVDNGDGGPIVYEHPLAYIEDIEKVREGSRDWNGWEIRELRPQHWEADYAEVFCSENPADVEDHIERCRPLLPKTDRPSQAFVWYLKDGPLVTFYRRPRKHRHPIDIVGRYLIPWRDWPQAREWSGTYDDILEQMKIEYPLPFASRLDGVAETS